MARKPSTCALCEQSNLACICPVCVNHRLSDYNARLKPSRSKRDSLHKRLAAELGAGRKAADQVNWRIVQEEKLSKMNQRLHFLKEKLAKDKAKAEKVSNDLKIKNDVLDSAFAMLEQKRLEVLEKYYPNFICTQNLGLMAITSERLHKQSVVVKHICRLFPMHRVNVDGEKNDDYCGLYDQICYARLPRGLDPHSVPIEELAASLGYMVQLLNLLVPNLAAPALHNAGFAGSCSRIWQRDSYWDARPSSPSKEYPLFIPRQTFCSSGGDNSWSDRGCSNFGVASVESERRPYLYSSGANSFNYSSASPHTIETHKELQKGISLLKKSVACITAYCYNSLGLDIPVEATTFEAFAKLLATLSSSKERHSVFSLKQAHTRSDKRMQRLNKSVCHANSVVSSSLAGSTHIIPIRPNAIDNNLSNSTASFLYSADMAELGKIESLVEEWDLVEHPTLPPPPSQVEDTEHWTRAMFTDATKK
ncbi:UV radiation resistance protein/autophagy-related protein 14 [Dioscorea alata]|uniref:UV radiation resistance protein/autophagy-related protein 14 n=1 Tax=Dioscorea alata TaxID=55571 RepID=A0ACB7W7K7_DIOAL|nr:UV radiation resistance protein/autophagy-related protein 14 [Dioscorea alata]